eukprot:scaffold118_cov206-Ochromonas_danica.AAC.2
MEMVEIILVSPRNGHIKIVKALMKDVDVNQLDENAWSPLGLACAFGQVEVVKAIMADPRLDLNLLVGKDGVSPLAVACANKQVEVVKLLLTDARVDVNLVNKSYSMLAYCENVLRL